MVNVLYFTLPFYRNYTMIRIFLIVLIGLLPGISSGQYKWTLERNQDGIKVYSADVPNSVYKAVRVECTLPGNYTKLISILGDVSQFNKWVYHSKNCKLLQKKSQFDFVYYTETQLPWPMSNRDAVIHIRFNTDSLPKFLTITGTVESGWVAPKSGLERVSHYKAKWKVWMPTAQTLRIHYEVEIDPGGSVPAWIANMSIDKGPFETFSNLAKKLKE